MPDYPDDKTFTIPSRQDLIHAVDTGIEAAGEQLSPERVDNLRSYAQTTDTFVCGTWMVDDKDPCPFAAVGGSKDDPGAQDFAKAYDAEMREVIGLDDDDYIYMRDHHNRPGPPAILANERGTLSRIQLSQSSATPR